MKCAELIVGGESQDAHGKKRWGTAMKKKHPQVCNGLSYKDFTGSRC